MAPVKILFLDDMEDRHKAFKQAIGLDDDIEIYPAYSAAEAIDLLGRFTFDQVFLDHDLSEDDIMCVPGERTIVPTGMTVVDHIIETDDPPAHVVIHSCNDPAATEMTRRLRDAFPDLFLQKVPFPWLLRMIETR